MKRIFFGVAALGCGVAALHYGSRFLQISDASHCYGNAQCQQMVERGGESKRDKQRALGLFALTGLCVWLAGAKEHA